MPFKSKAQANYMFSKHPRMAKEWAAKTPKIKKLPKKLRKKKASEIADSILKKLSAVNVTDQNTSLKSIYEDSMKASTPSPVKIVKPPKQPEPAKMPTVKAPTTENPKIASVLAWKVLVKLAAVDPELASHIKRVAKRMGYQVPSAKDLDKIFPKGWEKNSPSWQVQLERSGWLKNQNVRQQSGAAAAAGDWSKSPGGYSAHRGPAGPGSWVSRGAMGIMKMPLLVRMLGSLAPSIALGALSKDIHELQRKRKHITKEEKAYVLAPTQRAAKIGLGIGLLAGVSVPLLANLPGLRRVGLRNIPGAEKMGLGLSSLIFGLEGSTFGVGVGGLSALPIAKRRVQEIKEKMKKRKSKEAA